MLFTASNTPHAYDTIAGMLPERIPLSFGMDVIEGGMIETASDAPFGHMLPKYSSLAREACYPLWDTDDV
jgi:hypothetical protein